MTNLELALSEEIKHPVKINLMHTHFEDSGCNVAVNFQIDCTTIPGCYEEDDKEEIPFCDDYEPPLWGIPDINRVLFNPPATIVFWGDGTKTVVKVREGDKFEKYAGFAMACMKKMFGSTGAAMEIMKEFDDTPEPEPKKEELKPKKLEPKPQKSSFVSDCPVNKERFSFSLDDIMNIILGAPSTKEEEKKNETPEA
jgi:hypothetical protein